MANVGEDPAAKRRRPTSRRRLAVAAVWLCLLVGFGPAIAAMPAGEPPAGDPPGESPESDPPPVGAAPAAERPAADDAFWDAPVDEAEEPQPPGEEGADAPPGFALAGDPERGRAIFAKSCASCHGEDGSGNGRIALDPPARDLRDAARMGGRSDWQVYRVIRDGGKALGMSARMIPWSSVLDEGKLHDVAVYVRSLARPSAGDEPPSDAAPAVVRDAEGGR